MLHVQNVITSGGHIEISPSAEIKLNYISADMIIPISMDNGKITEAAFASEVTEKGKKFLKLETHLLDEKGNYIIKYYRFKADNDTLAGPAGRSGRTYVEMGVPRKMVRRDRGGG